jgi:hypothetical protein
LFGEDRPDWRKQRDRRDAQPAIQAIAPHLLSARMQFLLAGKHSLYRTGDLSWARFIGAQVSLPLQLQIERHPTYTTLVSRFFAGEYLKETPPGRSVIYLKIAS